MEDLKSATPLSSAVELKWLLAAYLPKKMEKHITEMYNIGKKAFQNLCCGKCFLIDYVIPYLNLCVWYSLYVPLFYSVNMTEAFWSPV